MGAARKVRWELMLKHELDEAVRSFPVAYLSFGLCEPHGLYNALGLDALKAHALCVRAATDGGGLVAPACFWHVHEDNPISRNWIRAHITARPLYLTSVTADLFFRHYIYQLRACVNAGFRAVIAVTGHYGGVEFYLKHYSKLFQKHVAPIPIWALADWEAMNYSDEHENYKGSHAGVCETAQLMALCPGLSDLHHSYLEAQDSFAGGKLERVLARVIPELGESIVRSQVENLVKGARQMLAEGSKQALPFIPMEKMEESWPLVGRQAPKSLSSLTDKDAEELVKSKLHPMWQQLRQANGSLPPYVFPEVDLEF